MNVIDEFIHEEYLAYPYVAHDDMLDALSKLTDDQVAPMLSFPDPESAEDILRRRLGGDEFAQEDVYEPF